MPAKDKDCAGCGQRLGEGYRFCPNCGTPRPTRSVQASPAQVFTPEEILAEEPPPASPEPSPKAKDEERVPEAPMGQSARPVPDTAHHIPAPQPDAGVTQPADEPITPLPLPEMGGVFGTLFGTVIAGLVVFVLLIIFGLGPQVAAIGTIVTLMLGAISMVLSELGVGRGRARRSSIRSAPAHSRSIPQWVKIAVATRDGGTCRRCGSSYELQYDHIIPFSRGGSSTDVSNIQLLCGKCNRRKSNRYVG